MLRNKIWTLAERRSSEFNNLVSICSSLHFSLFCCCFVHHSFAWEYFFPFYSTFWIFILFRILLSLCCYYWTNISLFVFCSDAFQIAKCFILLLSRWCLMLYLYNSDLYVTEESCSYRNIEGYLKCYFHMYQFIASNRFFFAQSLCIARLFFHHSGQRLFI